MQMKTSTKKKFQTKKENTKPKLLNTCKYLQPRNASNCSNLLTISLKKNKFDIEKNLKVWQKKLLENYNKTPEFMQLGREKIPSRDVIITIIDELFNLMFPGYYGIQDLTAATLEYDTGINLHKLFNLLSEQISKSFRHKCSSEHYKMCIDCYNKGIEITKLFLDNLRDLRLLLIDDIKAALVGDPAAKSIDEIIFSYPGFKAIFIYRIANALLKLQTPLIPRIMTEYAHSITGIDIHPGATIGRYFFIDHGTGVVIGETSIIGDRVKIYQGVTLGALSVHNDPKKIENLKQINTKSIKRHPTIEDDCVIYAGATILGGNTVIGRGSIIGGNVWLTESIPPYSKVMSGQCALNKISVRNLEDNNKKK